MRAVLEFPAVRGIQAGREYYVSMCPLGLVPKIFVFNDIGIPAEQRAQRQLNRGRVPEITRYLIENKDSYVFSALTASIDGEAQFTPSGTGTGDQFGTLSVQMNSARIVINDGQHRRAAIEAAIEQAPALADETIAVVLFHDRGLERCQQMFADLNRYAVRPSRSLSVLYDHRDDQALLAKLVVSKLPELAELVEMERSSLSPRSKPLFTLSAIYTATAALLADIDVEGSDARAKVAADFWARVARHMPQWEEVRAGRLTSGAVRDTYIHSHGVVLHALGRVGNALLKSERKGKKDDPMARLELLDWRRVAPDWEGRAVVAGRMSKTHQSVTLTANRIKRHLGLELSADEQALEDSLGRNQRAA
jgi:DNA sulfur modification protein DndB